MTPLEAMKAWVREHGPIPVKDAKGRYSRYLIGKPSSRFVVLWDEPVRWRLYSDHVSLGRLSIWWQR